MGVGAANVTFGGSTQNNRWHFFGLDDRESMHPPPPPPIYIYIILVLERRTTSGFHESGIFILKESKALGGGGRS